MLSIGKLVTGAEEYYLGVVASGREDYYTGGGEAQGVWLGRGSSALGLEGRVGAGQLRVLLAGFSPTDGRRLTGRPMGSARVTGFDLTFSAPKSVSVLWGLADPEVSRAVRRAHDAAVADALGYMERHATAARRGAGGERRIGAGGLVAAGFRHRTSRSGDPQLHTHVLVANAVEGSDGRWTAPDARLFYFHARTGGFVYQAVLRSQLAETLGVRFGLVEKGTAEILGIDQDLLRHFATRRADIEAALERRGASSPRAAQLAALATRPTKPSRDITLALGSDSLPEKWRRRARDLGLGIELGHVLGPSRLVEIGAAETDAMVAALLGPRGLTQSDSTFERRDVVRAMAERLPDGGSAALLDVLTEWTLASDGVVTLGSMGRGGGPLHTTTELLAIEKRILAMAEQARGSGSAVVSGAGSESTLAGFPLLSEEQRTVVRRLVTSGDGVEVVVGKAGSGKTLSLEAARTAWEAEGWRVSGATLAARAAAELQERSGVSSDTVAALLSRLERGEDVFGPAQVLVLDEAAMVGTRALASVLGAATEAGTKVVLVGDHRQLPEIEAGGVFAALARDHDAGALVENRRQHHAWERRALDDLRSGDVRRALAAYDAQGRIHQGRTMTEVRDCLVADWLAARNIGSKVHMFAVRHADVDALNRKSRSCLRSRGEIGPTVMESAGRDFAVGDEVICLRNDRRLGVRNGTRGRVLSGGEGFVVMATDDGTRQLEAKYVDDGGLDHGYATTIHKAQGETVDRAFVLGTASLYREAAYVAMSRARVRSDLYVVAGDLEWGIGFDGADTLDDLVRTVSVSRAKELALQSLDRTAPPGERLDVESPARGRGRGR
ncbi:MAG: MobF family relaxase [Acidimicrobiales bacterium]